MDKYSSCLCCRSERLQPYLMIREYQLDVCLDCDFVQVRNPPADTELQKIYDELHLRHVLFRSAKSAEVENTRRLKLVRKFVSPGATLLDAGCGRGDFICQAKEYFKVSGVDISSEAIRYARERLSEFAQQLFVDKLENFNPNGQQWDVVCSWDVIEHAKDPHSVMQKLVNAVKPGGILIISTPDIASLAARVMRRRWAFLIPPYHLSYFNAKTLTKVVNAHHSFEILRIQKHGKLVSLPFLAYKLNQMAPRIFPIRVAHRLANGYFSKAHFYVATNDILYAVYRKN